MSTSEGKRPKALGKQELRRLVLDAIKNGVYSETYHARFDHVERCIDINDVLHGLQLNWQLEREPEFDNEFWQWQYRIVTKDIEGNPLTIVIAADTRNRSFEVITRWSN